MNSPLNVAGKSATNVDAIVDESFDQLVSHLFCHASGTKISKNNYK